MIDGYSVQEAASVLGVPEGRVWELLARGVLSGTPEGDSMRVFLKSQAGPIVSAGTPARDEPPRSNGNGGSHNGGEASAFRELLTEFRNLTERYGQALLALGEARGEVAGLRSRVDLLEARLDLRLPPAQDPEPVAWESTPAAAPEPLPPAPATIRAPRRRAAAPSPPPKVSSPRKARSSREAVAGFAEALARAEDPTAAEMPSPPDAPAPPETPVPLDASPIAEATPEVVPEAAPESDIELSAEAIAEAGPDALAEDDMEISIEAIPVVAVEDAPEAAPEPDIELSTDEPSVEADLEVAAESVAENSIEPEAAAAPSYSAEVVEPDWFADGDFAWLDVAEIEARGTAPVEDTTVAPETQETEAETSAETEAPVATAEPEVEALPEPQVEALPELATEAESPFVPEPALAAEAQIAEAWEPDPRADLPIEPEPEVEAPPLSSFEIAAEPAPSGTSVRDLEPELMPSAAPAAESEPAPEPAPEGGRLQAVTMVELPGNPDTEPRGGAVEARAVPAGHVADEEELMWLGRRDAGPTTAASEMEVAAPGWRPGPATSPARAQAPAADAWPASDVETVDEPRPLAMTEDELTRLARAEGWDAAEVAAIRAMIASSPPPSPSAASTPLPNIELPGADELDEAIAALESAAVAPAADPSRSWAKPPQRDEPVAREEWAYESEPPPPAFDRRPPIFSQGPTVRRPLQDPGWLRTRRGPAATAYRRLRRLFPG